MTSISKSAPPKRDERRKAFRLASSFCLVGTCPTRTVLTRGACAREGILSRKEAARLERPPRNRDYGLKTPHVSEDQQRGEAAHEEEKANDGRASSVSSRPPVSRFARESRGLG